MVYINVATVVTMSPIDFTVARRLGFGHRTTLRLTPFVNKSWWIVLTCWRVFIAYAVLEPAYIDAKIALGAWHAWPFWGEQSVTLSSGQTVTPDAGLSSLTVRASSLPAHDSYRGPFIKRGAGVGTRS